MEQKAYYTCMHTCMALVEDGRLHIIKENEGISKVQMNFLVVLRKHNFMQTLSKAKYEGEMESSLNLNFAHKEGMRSHVKATSSCG